MARQFGHRAPLCIASNLVDRCSHSANSPRAEITRLDSHTAEMRAKPCSPEDMAACLADRKAGLGAPPLPEQKALMQSSMGAITVSQSEDIAAVPDDQDRANAVRGRTRRLTVTVQMRAPPERREADSEKAELRLTKFGFGVYWLPRMDSIRNWLSSDECREVAARI